MCGASRFNHLTRTGDGMTQSWRVSHDAEMKMDQHEWKKKWPALCSVTYEGPRKALLKEDAGWAHDVVQHVAVLHQRSEGIVEQLILCVRIFLSLQLETLLARCSHLPIHNPLQR